MNLRAVAGLLSRLVSLVAISLLLPLGWCVWFEEPRGVTAFVVSAATAATLALGLRLYSGGAGTDGLYRREGILIVVAGWLLASVLGALPYLLSGALTSPTDALFEAASGFTTTGASVMTDIEAQAGRGVLFWRCLTQWLGGLGIIVLFVALLSELGPGARFLYKLEVPGPTAEVLQPHVRHSAIYLWRVYLGLTLLETVLLKIAGLDLYHALTHSLSTLSTGGFSPRNASIAAFDSALVDAIVIVFMFVAGINFSLFYSFRARPNFFRDREFTVYAGLTAGVTLWVTIDLLRNATYESPLEALRYATFQVVSLMTTTGFATADFDQWSDAAKVLLLMVMLIGGCAGSTAGGIKTMRVLIAFKAAVREARRIFKPNTIMTISVGGAVVPGWVSSSVAGFVILYFFLLAIGTVVLALGGTDLITAATATLACLGNIGPGLEVVGPTQNFAHFGAIEKLVLVVLMWLGRLEILAIAAVATRAFWRD